MCQEYYKWLEAHPNATEEERKEAWEKQLRLLEARNYIISMFLKYR